MADTAAPRSTGPVSVRAVGEEVGGGSGNTPIIGRVPAGKARRHTQSSTTQAARTPPPPTNFSTVHLSSSRACDHGMRCSLKASVGCTAGFAHLRQRVSQGIAVMNEVSHHCVEPRTKLPKRGGRLRGAIHKRSVHLGQAGGEARLGMRAAVPPLAKRAVRVTTHTAGELQRHVKHAAGSLPVQVHQRASDRAQG